MKTIRESGFYWCRIDKLLLFTMSTRVSLLKISSLFENLFLEIQTYSCIRRYAKTGKGNSPNSQLPTPNPLSSSPHCILREEIEVAVRVLNNQNSSLKYKLLSSLQIWILQVFPRTKISEQARTNCNGN